MSTSISDQLVHFVSDMYSVEQQALAQLKTAPQMAGDSRLAEEFRQHYVETEEQSNMVEERLSALGGSPSTLKDAIMRLGGKGFLLFARLQPETPGKLLVHSYAYEAMEWAGYQMLERFARRSGDTETEQVAIAIGAQEGEMMHRLERSFDMAEEASHSQVKPGDIQKHLLSHLADAHALDLQAIKLLKTGEGVSSAPPLRVIYDELADQLRDDSRVVDDRLETLGSDSSTWKDAALKFAALNWSMFFRMQSDTPAKLAAFVYAVLHLGMGGYEMLLRTAKRAGDVETADICSEILTVRRGVTQRLADQFEAAVGETLEQLS
jgi:ferritin-like metal-binding protein YciE